MAMTELTLVFLGSLATLTSIGLFVEFGDDVTRALLGFAASVMWALFGMSAFDVIVRDGAFATSSEPIYPLAYLGIGLSLIIGLFSIRALFQATKSETESADISGLTR